jgi:hypothetical protein
MNPDRRQVIEKIYDAWGHTSQAEICVSIFNFLISDKSGENLHLTFGLLKQVVNNYIEKNYFEDREIIQAINYCSGSDISLLNVNFELIEGENVYQLDKSEVSEANKTGELIHPETGEKVDDFQDKVFIYFTPSTTIEELMYENVN